MKGIDVVELFEKRGLGRHELVDAVYGGLHPIHFGAELVPHDCLSCVYADQDGLSHCRGAVGTANSRTEECGYTVLTDKEFYERLMDCEFIRSEVEEYLSDLFPHVRAILPRATNVTVDKPVEDKGVTPSQANTADAAADDNEPNNPVGYAEWRRGRATVGQIMLEIQERWGRPPKKIVGRADIAHIVQNGTMPPLDMSTNLKISLENYFDNHTRTVKR